MSNDFIFLKAPVDVGKFSNNSRSPMFTANLSKPGSELNEENFKPTGVPISKTLLWLGEVFGVDDPAASLGDSFGSLLSTSQDPSATALQSSEFVQYLKNVIRFQLSL